MKVNLQVLASTSIKRRKPWPRFAWLGKESPSLFLLREKRIGILYIPSGKTKRKISKIDGLVKESLALNHSANGHYLVGISANSTIFVWEKESNNLTSISGHPDLDNDLSQTSRGSVKIYVSDSVDRILVLVNDPTRPTSLYMWAADTTINLTTNATGNWWRIADSLLLCTPRLNRDLTSDTVFFSDPGSGDRCSCAFAYKRDSATVRLAFFYVTWFPSSSVLKRSPPVQRWQTIDLPLSETVAQHSAEPVPPKLRRGVFVLRWSRSGDLLAVAINSFAKKAASRVLFFSPAAAAVMVAVLPVEHGVSSSVKMNWVCDMSWTHDDTYLVTINRLGSICLLSKLGDPLVITTRGCSMDLPPALSLNIHPLVFVRWPGQQHTTEDDASQTATDVLKQRFSVSAHPYLPVFLCSDGYMVTTLQLPRACADPLSLARSCLRHTIRHVKAARTLLGLPNYTLELPTLDSALVTTTRQKWTTSSRAGDAVLWESSFRSEAALVSFEAVPPNHDTSHCSGSDDDSSHLQSERLLHHLSAVGNRDSGTLHFGSHAHLSCQDRNDDELDNVSVVEMTADMKREVTSGLLRVWGLCVGGGGPWSTEWETLARKVAKVLGVYCRALVDATFFEEAVTLLESCMHTLLFDALRKRTLSASLYAFVTVFSVLTAKLKSDCPLKSKIGMAGRLVGCLDTASRATSQAFAWNRGDVVFPSALLKNGSRLVGNYVSGDTGEKSGRCLARRRFAGVWRGFYGHVVRLFRSSLTSSTDEYLSVIELLGAVQLRLQSLGIFLSTARKRRTSKCKYDSERSILTSPDNIPGAVAAWKEAISLTLSRKVERDTATVVDRIAHAILYALLASYRMSEVVEFIYWVFDGGLGHLDCRVVKTFARFLALRLASSEPACIYPFHRPHRTLFPLKKRGRARVLLHSHKLIQSIQGQGVDQHFDQNVATALLLMAGCTGEAAALARRLGDWSTEFILWIAHSGSGHPVQGRLETMLCERWWATVPTAAVGIRDRRDSGESWQSEPASLEVCLPAAPNELFLVAALCNVNLVGPVLSRLLHDLKQLVRRLPLLVPDDVYLPCPPSYCPQPNKTTLRRSPATSEGHSRLKISDTVQLFTQVLRSANCAVTVVEHYLSSLLEAFNIKRSLATNNNKESNSETPSWPLQELLEKLMIYRDEKDERRWDGEVLHLVTIFRDFCTVLWFLNVRDKANRHLRKFKVELSTADSAAWQSCQDSLQYVLHLIPFARFAGWELECHELIVSILLEAPVNQRSSAVLAYCWPDMDGIPVELDPRVTRLLSRWRTTLVKVRDRRGRKVSARSLSAIHLEQCQKVRDHLQEYNLAFGDLENDIFLADDGGAPMRRRFEIEGSFFEFLELFLDVGIFKDLLSDTASANATPHLPTYRKTLAVVHHMDVELPKSADMTPGKRKSLQGTLVEVAELFAHNGMTSPSQSASHGGLFRSLSLENIRKRPTVARSPKASMCHRPSVLHRAVSLPMLDQGGRSRMEPSKEGSIVRHSSLLNLCRAVSTAAEEKPTRRRRSVDDYLLKLLAWLIRWAQRNPAGISVATDGDDFPGAPRLKIAVTLEQIIFAVARPMTIGASLVVNRTVKTPKMPNPSMASTPNDDDKREERVERRLFFTGDETFPGATKKRVIHVKEKLVRLTKKLTGALIIEKNVMMPDFISSKNVSIDSSDISRRPLDESKMSANASEEKSDDRSAASTSRWSNSCSSVATDSPSTLISSHEGNAYDTITNGGPTSNGANDGVLIYKATADKSEQLLFALIRPEKELEPRKIGTRSVGCSTSNTASARLVDVGVQVNKIGEKSNAILVYPVDGPDDTLYDVASQETSLSTSPPPNDLGKIKNACKLLGQKKLYDGKKIQGFMFGRRPTETEPSIVESLQQSALDLQLPLLRLPAERDRHHPDLGQPNSNFLPTQTRTSYVPQLLILENQTTVVSKVDAMRDYRRCFTIRSHEEIDDYMTKLNVNNDSKGKCSSKAQAEEALPPFPVLPPLLQLKNDDFNKNMETHLLKTIREGDLDSKVHFVGDVPVKEVPVRLRKKAWVPNPQNNFDEIREKHVTLKSDSATQWYSQVKDVDPIMMGKDAVESLKKSKAVNQGLSDDCRKSYSNAFTATTAIQTANSASQTSSLPTVNFSPERKVLTPCHETGTTTDAVCLVNAAVNTDDPPETVRRSPEKFNNLKQLLKISEVRKQNIQAAVPVMSTGSQTNAEDANFSTNSIKVAGKSDDIKISDPIISTAAAQFTETAARKKGQVADRVQALDVTTNRVQGEKFDLRKLLNRIEQLDHDGFLSVEPVNFSTEPVSRSAAPVTSGGSNDVALPVHDVQDVSRDEVLEWIEAQKRKRESATEPVVNGRKLSRSTSAPAVTVEKMKPAVENNQLKKRLKMGDSHYRVRRKEAVELMKELIADNLSAAVRSAAAVPQNRHLRRTQRASVRRKVAAGPTYVLARGRGLIPVEGHLDNAGSTAGSPLGRFERIGRGQGTKAKSCPASPQRLRRAEMSTVGRPTTPKPKPTTYTERLKSLQGSYVVTQTVASAARSVKRMGQTFTLTELETSPLSRSSSADTLSPWIIPEDVERILQS